MFPCFLHHQLPSNPISHQLSRRECFYLLVYIKASPPSDSEASGEIFRLKVFLSRVMRCQEGEGGGGEEDDPPLVPRLGTRTGSTLLFPTTTRFCDMKQKRNYSFLTSRSIAKTSYTIRSSGVLLQTGRVFVMIFIVGVFVFPQPMQLHLLFLAMR